MADPRDLTKPFGRMMRWPGTPDPFLSLRGEMDDLLGRYIRTTEPNGVPGEMLVAVDIEETDTAYVFKLDVPGVQCEEISIDFEAGRLTITGERTREVSEDKASQHRAERSFGAFRTAFALPRDVNGDKIDAKLKDGVLTVTAPKSDDAKKKAKQIAVKGG